MKRLNQLITRLFIIALIALAVWVGRENLAKRALEYHLTDYVGASVTIKRLNFNRATSSLYINELEAADPLAEMKNLLQFDDASLVLDVEHLKDRRLVIEQGRLSEVKFGTPRTKSGKLVQGIFDPQVRQETTRREEVLVSQLPTRRSLADLSTYSNSQRWKDSLLVDLSTTPAELSKNFETEAVIDSYRKTWSERFAKPSEDLQLIATELSQMEKDVFTSTVDRPNPLRVKNKFFAAKERLDRFRLKLEELSTVASQFANQAQKDRYELSQTRVRDQRSLTVSRAKQEFDPGLINQLLLGELEEKLVQSGVDWLVQVRDSLPDPAADFRPVNRGRNLYFGKTLAKPKFEIRNLQIDGAAEFANCRFKFAGTIQNLSDNPAVHSEPIEFNLRAQGDHQLNVSGTIDRRGEQINDTIEFVGNSLPSPVKRLGDRESMLLMLADECTLHVDATIHVSGNDIVSGKMVFDFENVILHADFVHDVAGGEGTAAVLNETVSGVRNFRIESVISGSVQQPQSDFVCGLGQQISAALEKIYLDEQQLALRKKENHLNKVLGGKLDQLLQAINSGILGLNSSIRDSLEKLKEMEKRISVAHGPDLSRPSFK